MSTRHQAQPTVYSTNKKAVPDDGPHMSWRRLLLVGTPLAWVVVAILHPAPENDSIYEDLSKLSGRWLAVHFAQLPLTVCLAAALWICVRHRSGLAARLTRLSLPFYMVFFSAFDAVAGIATGVAVRHGNSLPPGDQAGAASTAEHLLLNNLAGDASPLAAISTIALSTAIVGVSMTWRQAGAAKRIWIPTLFGTLLSFHGAGPIPAVGLLCLAWALFHADRSGLLPSARRHGVGSSW